MTARTATKEKEPALDLGMKDITPKEKTVGGHRGPKGNPDLKNPPSGGSSGKAVALAAPHRAPTKSAADKVRAESMSIIEIAKECAMNPLVDAGKMREVIAMAREEQNRIDDRIFQLAKMEVQNKIPPITRDSLNNHTKSKWARLEKISAVADPIIRKNGFSLSYGSADCPLPDHYRITCDVTHTPTGYTKHYWIDVGMDSAGAKGGGTKSLAQGSGSSVTYARRFLKVMIFDINIVGEDFDGSRFTVEPKHIEQQAQDAEDGEPQGEKRKGLSLEQSTTMVALIQKTGVPLETFLKKYGIKGVIDLPPEKIEDAVTACNNYAEAAAKPKAAK